MYIIFLKNKIVCIFLLSPKSKCIFYTIIIKRSSLKLRQKTFNFTYSRNYYISVIK